MVLTCVENPEDPMTLSDNGSGKVTVSAAALWENVIINFDTPIKFTTNIYCTTVGHTGTWAVSVTGWEE